MLTSTEGQRYLRTDVPERFEGAVLCDRAEGVLAEGDAAARREMHELLLAWHERYHSRNRPPDLDCTGCRVWPLITRLRRSLEDADAGAD